MEAFLIIMLNMEAELIQFRRIVCQDRPWDTNIRIDPDKQNYGLNIARGTTDPEIDALTWIKLVNNMAPLTLVANLANRWRHLH